jgi:hypothetical protein
MGRGKNYKEFLAGFPFKHMDTSLLDLPIPYGNPEKAQ